jgi:hypothetical protein
MFSNFEKLFTSDLLIYLSDFLNDYDSFHLFILNKNIYKIFQKNKNKYSIKKWITENELYKLNDGKNLNKLHIYKSYKIKKYIVYNNIETIPKHITHLTFINNFNKKINNLPDTITHLTFGDNFNQYIKKFPQKLTHLIFGYDFNKPLINLPKTLLHLSVGYDFNNYLNEKNIPKCIIYLTS